jgi:hypothetical protein
MRKFILFFLLLSLFGYRCFAQNQVIVDKYPAAVIFVVDPQSGQEVQATDGNAVLFKDAFIDLVTNTPRARMTVRSPGHKSFVITQTDPANGNAFQLTQQSRIFGQDITNYTFSYNVDQNTLYYLDPNSQSWLAEVVQGYNVLNLNNCLAYGKFNEPNNNNPPQQAQDASQQPPLTTPLHPCRMTYNLIARLTGTYGNPVIGHMARAAITGLPEHGWRRQPLAIYGHRHIGDLKAAYIFIIVVTGVQV